MPNKTKEPAALDRDADGNPGGSTGLVPVVTLDGRIEDMPIGEARAARDGGAIIRFADEKDLKIAGRL